jgi:hypothetical protein
VGGGIKASRGEGEWVRKIISSPLGFFNSPFLSLYRIRTSFFVCIVLVLTVQHTQHKPPCPWRVSFCLNYPAFCLSSSSTTHNTNIHASGAIRIRNPACDRLQTHQFDRSATGIRTLGYPAHSKSLYRLRHRTVHKIRIIQLPLYRPKYALRATKIRAPRIFRQSAHESGKTVSQKHQLPSTPGKNSGTRFFRG